MVAIPPLDQAGDQLRMYRHMVEDVDIQLRRCRGRCQHREKGQQIFDEILAVASGKRTKSEALGYGEAEYVPWQLGATM
ncbi:altronate hydrolase [Mesorhizobium sp. B2-6-5]|uniref:altronate hydrolase n=1 Tax=Mesorhizobium sp. B2-6-5 TaxID=2589912 RepID=UPI0032B29B3D